MSEVPHAKTQLLLVNGEPEKHQGEPPSQFIEISQIEKTFSQPRQDEFNIENQKKLRSPIDSQQTPNNQEKKDQNHILASTHQNNLPSSSVIQSPSLANSQKEANSVIINSGFAFTCQILLNSRLFPVLEMKVNAFFGSFKHLGKTFFPLACVILFYSIIGISFFQGHIESRCRTTEHPEDGKWEADESIEHTCGYLSCPEGLTCGNPADYDISAHHEEYDNEEFLWGYSNFNNTPKALFSVYNFLMVTGWVQTTYIYWRAQDKVVGAIYFVSLVLLLSQIFSNIVLATLYEGFLNSSSIKNELEANHSAAEKTPQPGEVHNEEQKDLHGDSIFKKGKVKKRKKSSHGTIGFFMPSQVEKDNKKKKSMFQVILQSQISNVKNQDHLNQIFQKELSCSVFCQFIKILFHQFSKSSIFHFITFSQIVGSTIILAMDNINLSEKEYIKLNKVDFGFSIILMFELFVEISGKGMKKYFKKNLNKLDGLIAALHIISYIIENKLNEDIFNPINQYFIFIRWTKILRCVKLLHNFTMFGNLKIYIQTYYQTLKSLPEFLIVFVVLILLFAQIGREVFSHMESEEESTSEESRLLNESKKNEMRVNYDSLEDSLIAVVLIFFNEEWHLTMYEYLRIVGYQSILFHLICMLICQVLYIRLFIAIFISNFMKWLRKYEIEYKLSQPYQNTVYRLFKKYYNILIIGNSINHKNHVPSIKSESRFDTSEKNESEEKNKIHENKQHNSNILQLAESHIHTLEKNGAQQQQSQLMDDKNSSKIKEVQLQLEKSSSNNQDNSSTKEKQNSVFLQKLNKWKNGKQFLSPKKGSSMEISRNLTSEGKSQKKINSSMQELYNGSINNNINNNNNHNNYANSSHVLSNILTNTNSKLPSIHDNTQISQKNNNHQGWDLNKSSGKKKVDQDKNEISEEYEELDDMGNIYNNIQEQETGRFEDCTQINQNQNKQIKKLNNNMSLISQQKNPSISLQQPYGMSCIETERDLNKVLSQDISQNHNNDQYKKNPKQKNHRQLIPQLSQEYLNQENENDNNTKKQNELELLEEQQSQSNSNKKQKQQNNEQSILKQQNSIPDKSERQANANLHLDPDQLQNEEDNLKSEKGKADYKSQISSVDSYDASLWLFTPNNKFRVIVKQIVGHKAFDFLMVFSIVIMGINLVVDSPFLDPQSTEKKIVNIIQIVLTIIFILEVLLQIIAYGFITSKFSYMKRNFFFNSIDIITTIASFFYSVNFWEREIYAFKILLIFRTALLMFFLSLLVKDINFAGKTLMRCLPRMIRLIFFAVLYLLVSGVLATKLLKGSMFSCSFPDGNTELQVETMFDCMDQGGDWLDSEFNFNNIFSSLQILFSVETSEGWMTIMFAAYDSTSRYQHSKTRHDSLWSLFFIQFFFIANICILNMFMGLVVETQLEMIEAEHKTENLHKYQKEWLFIKQSIYKLSPIPVMKVPSNIIRKILHNQLVYGYGIKIIFYAFTIANCISFTLYENRLSQNETNKLEIVNGVCLGAMSIEILLKIICLHKEYFQDNWNKYDLVAMIVGWINFEINRTNEITIFSSSMRIYDGIAKGMQLLRFYRIMQHFTIIKKLFKSLQYAISSIFGIFLVMIIFLFMSVLLSINLFPFLKEQKTINEYDLHFRTFFQALFALIRIMTSEAWFSIPTEASKQMQPNFVCRDDIILYEDYIQYGQNACGTVASYLFFYAFFLIFTLVILNIFIATIIESYKEAFSADESAVNHYQLDDVLELWKQYDPEGKGYISYKEFWQFSSQIAIIYGVESEELRDISNKNKFLKTLNIPIFEDPINRIFCYKFHDVVISLSKISVQIKYGITNLEPNDENVRNILEKLIQKSHLKGDGMIKPTPFTSADMVLMIVLTRKVKQWKNKFLKKEEDCVFDIKNLTNKLRGQIRNNSYVKELNDQVVPMNSFSNFKNNVNNNLGEQGKIIATSQEEQKISNSSNHNRPDTSKALLTDDRLDGNKPPLTSQQEAKTNNQIYYTEQDKDEILSLNGARSSEIEDTQNIKKSKNGAGRQGNSRQESEILSLKQSSRESYEKSRSLRSIPLSEKRILESQRKDTLLTHRDQQDPTQSAKEENILHFKEQNNIKNIDRDRERQRQGRNQEGGSNQIKANSYNSSMYGESQTSLLNIQSSISSKGYLNRQKNNETDKSNSTKIDNFKLQQENQEDNEEESIEKRDGVGIIERVIEFPSPIIEMNELKLNGKKAILSEKEKTLPLSSRNKGNESQKNKDILQEPKKENKRKVKKEKILAHQSKFLSTLPQLDQVNSEISNNLEAEDFDFDVNFNNNFIMTFDNPIQDLDSPEFRSAINE